MLFVSRTIISTSGTAKVCAYYDCKNQVNKAMSWTDTSHLFGPSAKTQMEPSHTNQKRPYLFSLRTASSSSGVKSLTMLKV